MGASTTHDLSLLPSSQPVHIVAENCGVITVNYQVTINVRDPDTLPHDAKRNDVKGALAQGDTL